MAEPCSGVDMPALGQPAGGDSPTVKVNRACATRGSSRDSWVLVKEGDAGLRFGIGPRAVSSTWLRRSYCGRGLGRPKLQG